MKKLISLLAASMLLTCSLFSCGDSDDESESGSSKNPATTSESGEADDTTDDEDTTEAATTKEASTKASKPGVTGTVGGDVIGKWLMDDATLTDVIGEKEKNGMIVKDAFIEFKDGGKMEISVNFDVSSMMCIKDEKPLELYGEDISNALTDKSFYIGGVNCPIYDFDGSYFKTGFSNSYYEFKRSEKSDDIYGKYELPTDFGGSSTKSESSYISFEKSGVCYMSYCKEDEYEYDSSTGAITTGEKDSAPSTVTFADDDTMMISDENGVKGTLIRAD